MTEPVAVVMMAAKTTILAVVTMATVIAAMKLVSLKTKSIA
jgi:hypothetical protein